MTTAFTLATATANREPGQFQNIGKYLDNKLVYAGDVATGTVTYVCDAVTNAGNAATDVIEQVSNTYNSKKQNTAKTGSNIGGEIGAGLFDVAAVTAVTACVICTSVLSVPAAVATGVLAVAVVSTYKRIEN
jgi:hypothetical protein